MKLKIMCEVEVDIKGEKELKSLAKLIDRPEAMKVVEREWKLRFEEKLKDVLPFPSYVNKKLRLKAEYFEDQKEIQHFQLGDTAYFIDEDCRFFESEVWTIHFSDGRYNYDTRDTDFEHEDVGRWVFKTAQERERFLENEVIDILE